MGKIWLAWTRIETGDIKIRFIDSNNNGAWDPGESIAYDSNNNGVYDTGEPVITGSAPATGTPLQGDPRIKFVDANGNGIWDPGEFVVYDPSLDALYNPKLRFVDSNNNGVWDPGETIIYDANSDGLYTSHTGVGNCTGTGPTQDCVIVGAPPANQTVLRTDPQLKFVDLNGDGVWEPGETLVYDSNNNNQFDTGEQAIAALFIDQKIKFIGPGATWGPGNTVVYDSNSNGVYDGKVKFIDANNNRVWDPGETVVYDSNLNSVYDLFDTPIVDPSQGALLGKTLLNDPALRFVDSNNNGVWDPGEAVVRDANLNNLYDGKIKFADSNNNGVWDPGETVIYDKDNNGVYSSGKFYNDTIIVGLAPANNTGLKIDPNIRFQDSNGNTVYDAGEPVIYDANNNKLYDAEATIAAPTPVPNTRVKNDTRITFVGPGTTWSPGNTVVYDTDSNGVYSSGKFHNDTIIAGLAPANNTALKFDADIKFVNATTSPSETWAPGKSVIYDANNNNRYDAETAIAGPAPPPATGVTTGLGETMVVTASPAVGALLKTDPLVKFVDLNANNIWDQPNEAVIYDLDNSGVYKPADPVIYNNGTLPSPGTALKTDPGVKYSDSNGNGVWDSAEAVVYDNNLNGAFDTGEFVIRGTIPVSGSALTISLGEPVIAGPAPAPGSSLKTDPKIKFVDLNGNLIWNQGEPVEYDSNNNGIFDPGDIIIAGTPVPSPGTLLKTDELTLAGTMASPNTSLSLDTKVKFVDSNNNNVWDPGETVVYDTDTSGPGVGVYNFGKFHNDTIVAGPPPANNTLLKTDSKIKYFEANADGHWDYGEPVFYDSNTNNLYDGNDVLIAVFQAPPPGATLKSDPLIKYFETGTDTQWDPGESVVYDANNNNQFNTGELTITGPTPANGTVLSTDSHLKFVDSNINGKWDRGETVVSDRNLNGFYDSGEPVLVSGSPAGGAALRTVPHIFYKTYNGTSWSADQRLTTQPTGDHSPSMTQTLDGRVWITWAGERGAPNQILYRTTTDGVTWTPEVSLASSSLGENDPSITQDRNGTIWIVWARNVPCGCGQAVFQDDLYYETSMDNGASWTPATPLTATTGQDEILPSLAQLSDRKLYIFFSTIICSGSTCTVNIYQFNTLILSHNPRMNSLATNSTNLRAGQWMMLKANVSNRGDFNDTMLVTIRANGTLVYSNSSPVLAGQTKLFTFNWLTTGMKPGKYTLTANVTTTGESLANMIDNKATITVLIRPAGDVDGNCVVNIIDLVLVAASFGKTPGSPGYNPAADLNGDGVVNIADLALVGSTFGQTC